MLSFKILSSPLHPEILNLSFLLAWWIMNGTCLPLFIMFFFQPHTWWGNAIHFTCFSEILSFFLACQFDGKLGHLFPNDDLDYCLLHLFISWRKVITWVDFLPDCSYSWFFLIFLILIVCLTSFSPVRVLILLWHFTGPKMALISLHWSLKKLLAEFPS